MPDVEKNHRHTKQKAAILDALKQPGTGHITVDELLLKLRAKGVAVGRATVYRYVKQLEDEGSIQKYVLPDRSGSCYAYLGPESPCRGHTHVKCRRCGAVLHVESGLPAQFSTQMLEQYQFEIDESKTVFYGTCRECRKESNE